MRFVPTNCLTEGMMVAQTLYGKNNEKLLCSGTLLTERLIESLTKLRFAGVYIDDEISRDIDIVNVISDELRVETTNNLKKVFLKAGDGRSVPNPQHIKQQVDSIITQLMENKNMMVNMVDLKCFDNYTYAHSVNVGVLALVIGVAAGFNENMLSKLGMGAILHDIGKVFINKNIINKPGRLTDGEFDEIKTHPNKGYVYTKEKFRLPTTAYMGILDHHEKFDGSGYPNAKAESDISIFGRIIAVADVYDALTSERPYRDALSPSESMEYIIANAGQMFDPDVVQLFIRKVAPYPVGTTVELSNGCTAIVLENFESFCLRPRVRVFKEGVNDVDPYELDLHSDYSALNIVIKGHARNDKAAVSNGM